MQYTFQTTLYTYKIPNRKPQLLKLMANNTNINSNDDMPCPISAARRLVCTVSAESLRSNDIHPESTRRGAKKHCRL